MEKKRASETGIRVEIGQGENSAVAVDALVDDFLHGKIDRVLDDLHHPHDPRHDDPPPTDN